MSKLALLGGEKTVKSDAGDMFKWPIVNREMEEAVLEVLRDGNMSGTDITKQFEAELVMSSKPFWYDRQIRPCVTFCLDRDTELK